MLVKHYSKTKQWIDKRRFQLLLFATALVLLIPAFSGTGRLGELTFWLSMTFLFIQSAVAANLTKVRRRLAWAMVVILILISSLKPIGLDTKLLEILKLFLISLFFFFILVHLFRFMRKSQTVNLDVLITAVNIYFLFGIIFASMAFTFFRINPDAYSFPAHILKPTFVTFLYYSFITMSTVGYGDIIPKMPQTQTLAYFIAVTGQLYVAIIIAFLVGKFLVHADQRNK